MTGPTTADLLDPAGEVTHECLDGAAVEIVDGYGIGQTRRILRRDGNRVEFDRPWAAPPDDTSVTVFTAPPLFERMTFVDNRVVSQAVNVIVWGCSHDVVIDGNYTADGPGITLWSVRLAGDQKVWGGAAFTQIVNNVADMGWCVPPPEHALEAAAGICFIASKHPTAVEQGYDLLGLVVRGNRATNNSGMALRMTFRRDAPGGDAKRWRARGFGLIMERNLCTDSRFGIVLEKDARVAVRGNRFRRVDRPLVWAEPAG
jgi:hypothetical protein